MRQNPRLAHHRRTLSPGHCQSKGGLRSDDSLDHDRLHEQKPSEKCEEKSPKRSATIAAPSVKDLSIGRLRGIADHPGRTPQPFPQIPALA